MAGGFKTIAGILPEIGFYFVEPDEALALRDRGRFGGIPLQRGRKKRCSQL
jgi:hypothetical protein